MARTTSCRVGLSAPRDDEETGKQGGDNPPCAAGMGRWQAAGLTEGQMARATAKATVRKARTLRSDMSLPEVLLWQILRTRPAGLKFRRQHPVGPYIADFYCASAKTVIEIDGLAHEMGDRSSLDEVRDTILRERGLSIIRILAGEVLRDATMVADVIVQTCSSPSTIRVADGPPPHSLREQGGS